MLRLGRIYPGKTTWGPAHMKWLMAQKLEHREQRIAFEEFLEGIRQESDRVERLENAIREAVPEWSLAEVVAALQAVRGIDLIATVGVLAEIGDLFRFQKPRELMGDGKTKRAAIDDLIAQMDERGLIEDYPAARYIRYQPPAGYPNAREASMRKAILISSGFLAVATVVLAAEVAVVPQRAQATPAYARQTGRSCGPCHVNRSGGGRLTADGAAFAKKHR
jgi:hypothetical protein